MTLTINGQTARPEMVQVQTPGGLLEATFSEYADFDLSDTVYPTRVTHTLDGETVLYLTLNAGRGYNPYMIFPIPESVSAGPPGRIGR